MPGEFAAPPTSFPNMPQAGPPKANATPGTGKAPKAAPVASPTPAPAPGATTKTDAPATDETPAEKKEAERIRLKYKSRGQDVEREYTHEDLARKLQIAEGTDEQGRRFRELEAQSNKRREDYKKRGLAAFRDEMKELGITDFEKQIDDDVVNRFQKRHKPDETGEKWVERTPEEVELDELRAFKKESAERETQTAAKAAKDAEAAEIEQYSQAFVKEVQPIAKALGYGKEYTEVAVIPAIGEVLMRAEDAGVQLTTQQAAAEAKELLDWRASEHFKNMDQSGFVKAVSARFAEAPVELLLEAVGAEGIEKILAHTVAQLRGGTKVEAPARPTERPRRQSNDEKIEAATHVVFGQRNR